MRYKSISLLISLFLIASCNGAQTQPSIAISNSPVSSTVLIPTQTSNPLRTPTISTNPLPTYPPYQVKGLILAYGFSVGEGEFASFDKLMSPRIPPKLALYNDGLLIATKDDALYQRILSKEEIHSFLSDLEQKGFYKIETNQKHDPTDKLYIFTSNYKYIPDGRYLCISTPPKNICAYEPIVKYVIPSMKSILKFLDDYSTSNIQPYHADRILLQVIQGSGFLRGEEKIEPKEWAADLPALGKTSMLLVYGESATKIFQLFHYSVGGWKIVTYNGAKYTIFARPVWPDEIINLP